MAHKKGWTFIYKAWGLFALISLIGLLSCNMGSNSTISGGAPSGVAWRVTVQPEKAIVKAPETTAYIVKVTDNTGFPAPTGTRICVTCNMGCVFVDLVKDACVTAGCFSTSAPNGQAMGVYSPPVEFTGVVNITATSMGAMGSANITVIP